MAFAFNDTFFVIDPYNPPAAGTPLTTYTYTVVDNNEDGDIDRRSHDTIDGVDITAAYANDTVTITTSSGQTITYTGASFYLADGRIVFTPTDGQDLQNGTFVSSTGSPPGKGGNNPIEIPVPDFDPPCFVDGSLIATTRGKIPVETIGVGDRVLTADGAPQIVRAVRRMTLSRDRLMANPRHLPVVISKNALGPGLPSRDLCVSPQHRMVLRSRVVERMFGAAEIMVPACQLVGLPGIARMRAYRSIDYIHILCDGHMVILAEDAPTESLFLGAQVHENLSARDIDVLRAHLPQASRADMTPARPFVRGQKLRQLLQRLAKNGRALVDPIDKVAGEYRLAG